MKEITIEAKVDNLDRVLSFVDEQLESAGCSIGIQTQIDIAVEEVFVNIAQYAYDPNVGPATISVETSSNPLKVKLTFMDKGMPYNPLAKDDPDVTQSADERPIGGLGIYMVKNIMDDVEYEYKDGQNIFTIAKNIE
ncbi:Anti-sigma regulatory factor (Ser/Thr protein kinase) [Lachnospiraceae bacterium XBB2008]|nr:Anti-sigma regulatory factor (Ser/Thr protein kinase) [Lachnospiraceae bacterium XBB2008]